MRSDDNQRLNLSVDVPGKYFSKDKLIKESENKLNKTDLVTENKIEN